MTGPTKKVPEGTVPPHTPSQDPAAPVLRSQPSSSRYQLGLVKKIAVVVVPVAASLAAGWNKVLTMADPQTVSDLHHMYEMHTAYAMMGTLFGGVCLYAGFLPTAHHRLSLSLLLIGAALISASAYNVARIYGNTTVDGIPCDPGKEVYVEDQHSPLTCTLAAPVTQDQDNDPATDNSLIFQSGRSITVVDGKIVEGTLAKSAPFGDLRASAEIQVELGCGNDVVCFGFENYTSRDVLKQLWVTGAPGMNNTGSGDFVGGCFMPHATSPSGPITDHYVPGCHAQGTARYYGADRPAVELWYAEARSAKVGSQDIALAAGGKTWNPDGTLHSATLAGPTKIGRATFEGEITLHHNGEVAQGKLAEPLDLGIGTLPPRTDYSQGENGTPISAHVYADEQTIQIDGHWWSDATLYFAGHDKTLHIDLAYLNAAHSYPANTPSGVVTYLPGGNISFPNGKLTYTPTTGGRGF